MRRRWLQVVGLLAGAAVLVVILTIPLATPAHGPRGTTPEVAASSPRSALASPVPATAPSAASTVALPTPPHPTPPPETGVEIGQLAPDFELARTDGSSLRLSSLRGQVVWINFWAPWCPACRTEMPRLEGFWLERQGDGLIVLGVGVQDTPEAFRAYAAEVGVSYPLVMDLDGAVAATYRALVLPVHFWIDRDGVVRDWAFGELPPDVFTSIVDAVMGPPQAAP